MPSIYDQPAGDLLFGIPLSARTVLEIGCGNGEFAARYKLLNPNCRYFGIEEDADAAGKAGVSVAMSICIVCLPQASLPATASRCYQAASPYLVFQSL